MGSAVRTCPSSAAHARRPSALPGSVFPLGTTAVAVTAVDAGGNYATPSFTVVVQDTTPPFFTSPVPSDMTVEATGPTGALVTFACPMADDAVSRPVTVICAPSSGSTFPLGTTAVLIRATDAVGNQAVASFNVTVRDTTSPVLTAPSMTVEATSPRGAYVTFTASATDAVGPVLLVFSISNGSLLPFGTTAVTVYAVDGAGNRSPVQTFTVTVRDTTAPSLTVPGTMVVEQTGPAAAVVTYSITASDAVGPITLTYSQASGTTFAPGTTPVTVTAADGAGNRTVQTFAVTVQDTTPPAIGITGVTNLAVYRLNGGPTPGFTVTDSGSGVNAALVVATLTRPASASGAGFYTYSVTARDNAGNISDAIAAWFVLLPVQRIPEAADAGWELRAGRQPPGQGPAFGRPGRPGDERRRHADHRRIARGVRRLEQRQPLPLGSDAAAVHLHADDVRACRRRPRRPGGPGRRHRR